MCCSCVGYKKCDVKTIEVVARGRTKKTEGSEARTGWIFCPGDFSAYRMELDYGIL